MIDIKKILDVYSRLLTSSWDVIELVSKNDQTESIKIDWQQTNWEILVEGLLGDQEMVLEVYGEGADCNAGSSRVLYPERLPTHKIICVPLKGSRVHDVLNNQDLDLSISDIVFDQFVSMGDDGWYYEKPNFDCVLASYDDGQVVINFEKTGFELKKI